MATHNYKIIYSIDDKQAVAVTKRAEAGQARIEAAANKAATSIEKSAEKAAAKAEKLAERQAAAAVKAAEKAAVAVERGLEKEATARDRIYAKATRDAAKMAATSVREEERRVSAKEKALMRESSLEDKYIKRAYNDRIKFEKAKERMAEGPLARQAQQNRRGLTETQVLLAARNRLIDAADKKRINAAMGGTKDMFSQGIANAFGIGSMMTGVGLATAGVVGAKSLISTAGEALDSARMKSREYTAELLGHMKGMRALASVEGKLPTAAFAHEKAGEAVSMGMSVAEATAFEETFHGGAMIVGPGAASEEDKHLSDADYREFMVKAARLGASKGMTSDVAATLASGVVKAEDFKRKGGAKAALGRLKGIMDILDAGRGLLNKLAPEYIELTALLASEDELEGVMGVGGEGAVFISSAADFAREGETKTMIQRAAKAMRDFTGKNKKKDAFFKRVGITSAMSLRAGLDKLFEELEKEVAKGIEVDTALTSMGFTGRMESEPLRGLFNTRKKTMARQFKRLAEAMSPEGMAKGETAVETTKDLETMRMSTAEAAAEKAKMEVGEKGKALAMARAEVEPTLIGERLDTSGKGELAKWWTGATTLFMRKGEDVIRDERALELARTKAGEAGPGWSEWAASMTPMGMMGKFVGRMDPGVSEREAKRLEDLARWNKAVAEGLKEVAKELAMRRMKAEFGVPDKLGGPPRPAVGRGWDMLM